MTTRERIHARYVVKVGDVATRHPDKTRKFVSVIHANHYARHLIREGYRATVLPLTPR